jgi:hypothetical protein
MCLKFFSNISNIIFYNSKIILSKKKMFQRTMVCVLMNSELIDTIIFFNVINKKIGYKNIILSL